MAIIDRTFSSLNAMAKYKFFSKVASFLLWFGSMGWQVQNDESFLKTKPGVKPYKIMMQDTADQVVCLRAQLMSGISTHLLK